MEYIQIISIVLEAVIALLFLMSAIRGRAYMFGLVITFSIYVWYDLAKLLAWPVDSTVLSSVFFVATIAALYSAWSLYKRR